MPTNTFLSLTNADLGLHSQQIQGVVYAPGLVCTRCLEPLNLGIVARDYGHLQLLGENCAEKFAPKRWIKQMESKKYFIKKSDFATDQDLSRSHRKYFRAAALNCQIDLDDVLIKRFLSSYRTGQWSPCFTMKEVIFYIKALGDLPLLLDRRDQISRMEVLIRLGMLLGRKLETITELIEKVRRGYWGLSIQNQQLVVATQNDFYGQLGEYTYQFLSHWPPKNGIISLD
jgi:hypothetical protein